MMGTLWHITCNSILLLWLMRLYLIYTLSFIGVLTNNYLQIVMYDVVEMKRMGYL